MGRLKGHIPWNKGLTKETDSRIITPIAAFKKGHIPWLKGKTKEQLPQLVRNRKTRDKISKSSMGKSPTKGMTGKHQKQSTKDNQSAMLREAWKDSEFAKVMLHRRTPSGEEIKFIKFLEDNDFKYKYVGNGTLIIDGKNPDFQNVNDLSKLIELWGDYFKKSQDPQKRIDFFRQYGYNTLVIYASELKYHPELVKSKIKEFERKDNNENGKIIKEKGSNQIAFKNN